MLVTLTGTGNRVVNNLDVALALMELISDPWWDCRGAVNLVWWF